jgi:ribosome-associated translation inhibitor RaiA
MADLLKPASDLIEDSPEVKSYIYQQISEFELFVTPETIVSVLAKDPLKLALQLETDGVDIKPQELSKMFRISMCLQEGDSQIQEEALDKNIFAAIRKAKEKLLARLNEIQDEVMSNQERAVQINSVLSQSHILH